MTKSQLVNVIANKYNLSREWLNTLKVEELEDMLSDFRTMLVG